MAGDFDEARSVAAKGRRFSTRWPRRRRCCDHHVVERDRAARRRPRRRGARASSALEQLQEIGERGNLASIAAQLAEALHAQGRSEEALAATVTSEEASSPDDVHAQISWRVARAKALAQLGRGREAKRSAATAVELAGTTDSPVFAAEALLALAEAHAAAGEAEEGREPPATRSSSSRRRGTSSRPAGRGARRGTGGTYSVDARVTVSAPSSSSRTRGRRRDAGIGRGFVHHHLWPPDSGQQELDELRQRRSGDVRRVRSRAHDADLPQHERASARSPDGGAGNRPPRSSAGRSAGIHAEVGDEAVLSRDAGLHRGVESLGARAADRLVRGQHEDARVAVERRADALTARTGSRIASVIRSYAAWCDAPSS